MLDSPPVKIQANEKYLMALQQDGKIAIFETGSKSKGIIELNCNDNEEAVFLDAILDENNVISVYGNLFNPTFERVDFLDKNGNVKEHYVLTRIVKDNEKINSKVELLLMLES